MNLTGRLVATQPRTLALAHSSAVGVGTNLWFHVHFSFIHLCPHHVFTDVCSRQQH